MQVIKYQIQLTFDLIINNNNDIKIVSEEYWKWTRTCQIDSKWNDR